jgi:PadR family transcriptional regulator PadR
MSNNMAKEIDNKITQLRKGILELAIMAALYHKTHYGYSLIRNLAGSGSVELKEGTIYPILARLAREGMVHSEWAESSQGPPRKYYSLTVSGRAMFESLQSEFQNLVQLVAGAVTGETKAGQEKTAKKITIRRNKDE